MKTIVYTWNGYPKYPDCDICKAVEAARYDAKTVLGPWGYLCERCFIKYGIALGTGYGQKLIRRLEDEQA